MINNGHLLTGLMAVLYSSNSDSSSQRTHQARMTPNFFLKMAAEPVFETMGFRKRWNLPYNLPWRHV